MKVAVLDLETYYDAKHSLKKMSNIAYCMHPDTEIISCAFKLGSAETVVLFGEQGVQEFCDDVDWSEYMVVGHNLSGFDAMILSWRLGIKPKMWGCTLAMARPLHAKDNASNPLSLGALVEHYKIGVKDSTALTNVKGKHLSDYTDDEIVDMEVYNRADVDQCAKLFLRLMPHTSKDELDLIDMTVRMLVEPQFDADMDVLVNALADEDARIESVLKKTADIMKLETSGLLDEEIEDAALTTLMSTDKLSEFLQSLNVTIPTKPSPADPTKAIPAFAKSDEEFLALQNHKDPRVAAVITARLDVKSTLLRSRIQKFIDAANAHPNKKVPMPLKYYGADTTGRWSGVQYNPQNLPTVNPKNPKPSDALRLSLVAPPGYKIVVADLSGIEMRVNHFLWQVPSSMKLFQDDPEADLYTEFASSLYKIPTCQVTKAQRQVGKVAHLGLGFQSGFETFQKVAKIMGNVTLTEKESQNIVNLWRSDYSDIKNGWDKCRDALPTILKGAEGKAIDPWNHIIPVPEGLQTPRGMIRYPSIRKEYSETFDRDEVVYGYGRNRRTIYGGKMVENIVQHLARCVIADNALAVRRRTGLLPALMVHDELVYVVPKEDAKSTLDTVQNIMRTPPLWWPELVTWSEGSTADNYGDAK